MDPTEPKLTEVDGIEKLYDAFISFLLEKEQISFVREMLNRPSRSAAMILLNITQKAIGNPIQIVKQLSKEKKKEKRKESRETQRKTD